MGRISDRFDFEKQLTFYLSYHFDQRNQLVHFVCVWPIMFASFIMASETKPYIDQPAFLARLPYGQYMVINFSALAAVVLMAWYIKLDPRAGSIGAAGVFTAYIYGNYFSQTSLDNYGIPAWHVALPIFIALWIAQFIGHSVFEHRKPALFDSLDQALVTAPMFVLLELLFSFGYRREFYEHVMVQVRANVLEFHGKDAFEKKLRQHEPTRLAARAQ